MNCVPSLYSKRPHTQYRVGNSCQWELICVISPWPQKRIHVKVTTSKFKQYQVFVHLQTLNSFLVEFVFNITWKTISSRKWKVQYEPFVLFRVTNLWGRNMKNYIHLKVQKRKWNLKCGITLWISYRQTRQPSKLTETISAAAVIRLLFLFSGVKVINTISIHHHSTDALSVDKVILI